MWAARGRPGSAAPSSCRSRTARAAPGTVPSGTCRSRSVSGVHQRRTSCRRARSGRPRQASGAGPVEVRARRARSAPARGGTDAGPSAIASSSISAAMPPIISASWRTVVRPTRAWPAIGMSSKPTTEIVSGTRRPRRSSASRSSIAVMSLLQQTAVGLSSIPTWSSPWAASACRSASGPAVDRLLAHRCRSARTRSGCGRARPGGRRRPSSPRPRRCRRRPGAGRGPRTRRRPRGCRGRAAPRGSPSPPSRRGR